MKSSLNTSNIKSMKSAYPYNNNIEYKSHEPRPYNEPK